MKDQKRILITGAGGFVGKRLTKLLSEQGHQVYAFLHGSLPKEDKIYFESERITILKGDLEFIDVSELPQNVDTLITLAQSRYFREFPKKSSEVFTVNVTANLTLFQWAISAEVKQVIHASSGGIYGGKLGKVFSEQDLLAIDSPLGFYLGTKLCSEIILQNYMNYFDSAVILRPFFIYGPGQRKDMFIARLIESVRSGNPIQLQGDEGLRVNPVYVEDAAVAFANALELTGSHIINVAGPDVITLKKLGEIVGKAVGKVPKFEKIDGNAVDYLGNTDQAVKRLNLPMLGIEEGILRSVMRT